VAGGGDMPLRPYQRDAVSAVAGLLQMGTRRVLVALPTGCHRVGQRLLMFDGSLKAVEEVLPGDLLMGPDSRPRTVLQLCRGEDEMVEVRPVKGAPWVVNREHVLTLVKTQQKRSGYPSQLGGGLVDVAVSAWQKWSRFAKHIHKLVRTGVEFPATGTALRLDPYFLGVLLGDGTLRHGVAVSKPDAEIEALCREQAEAWGLTIRTDRGSSGCPTHHFAGTSGRRNPLTEELHRLGLSGLLGSDRFIPQSYLLAPRADRRALLAGILDTDGSLAGAGFDFISKSPQLSADVAFIARSLGLAAYGTPCEKYCQTGNGGTYFRVSISGDCSAVPLRIPRKKAASRQQVKDVLRTGFSVCPTGTREPYYGFTLDGDGRYLLDDFTITHNTGKTVVFAHLVGQPWVGGKRVLVLAHRGELLKQAMNKIRRVNPGLTCEIEQAELRAGGAQVVVASVPTLQRKRLAALDPKEFGLIVIDEAHHATAPSYRAILSHFGADTPEAAVPVAGFTATPGRSDGVGLSAVFEEIAYEMDLPTAIEDRWLVPLVGHSVRTEGNLRGVKTRLGDFEQDALARAVNTDDRNGRIVAGWRKLAMDRTRTVVFAVDVAHAHSLVDTFRRTGVACEALDGETPKDERAAILERLSTGETRVLANCMVLTEGFDEPAVDCVIVARPTRSKLLYTQMVGRGSRLCPPDKHDCLVLDCADREVPGVATLNSLFGLSDELLLTGRKPTTAEEPERKRKPTNPLELKARLERLRTEAPWIDQTLLKSLDDLDVCTTRIEFFAGSVTPAELQSATRLQWMRDGDGYGLGLSGGDRLQVHPDRLGRWMTRYPNGQIEMAADARAAVRAGDRWLREERPREVTLVDGDAGWRTRAASDKQVALLQRMGVRAPAGMTRGQAAAILTLKLGKKR